MSTIVDARARDSHCHWRFADTKGGVAVVVVVVIVGGAEGSLAMRVNKI